MPQSQKDHISKSVKITWNLPEMKKLNSEIQQKRMREGTHNFIQMAKMRRINARINEYDLTTREWKILRAKIKERDNWVCQNPECRADLHKRKSNCHHKIPYAISKDNSEDNLETLCIPCHTKKEYILKKKFSESQ